MGVRYVYQKNSGVASARNVGIFQSKGQYVAFLDADDLWLPDKLELQLKALKELNVGAVACGYKVIDYISGRTLSEIVRRNYPSRENLYQSLCISQIIPACSSGVLINKSYLKDVGCFSEALPIAEDWELWLRVAKKYDIKFVEQPLVLIRINLTKPSFRVASNEEIFVSQVIEGHVPDKCKKKAYAALYARLGSGCMAGLDKKGGARYLLRSILIQPFRIYPKDQKNVYKYPQIWRYYLLMMSIVPEALRTVIKRWYRYFQKDDE
jgi:glycosyltransferase involved in cell wall biosynthesis